MRARSRLRPLGLALCLALAYPAAQGLPQGAQVAQGQVKVSTPQAGQGLIQQASDKAVINWQSFSIGAHESLRIEQPNVNSVLLNRVVGGDPSLILGRMESNGQVFLLNPRGIVFGRGSQVNVGGLVAATLDLSDAAFLAGDYRFKAGPGAGGLQADGSIAAPGGTVALLAPQLNVGGSIQARRVGLAAASTVQVDVEGDGLVLFNLRNDDHLDVALKFSGRIQTAGGSTELRAQARAGAVGQVLNMDGVVQARGLRQQGGRIVIDGGTAGDTYVNGTLDAGGERGGSITVLGQRVAVLDPAVLDASGAQGGGCIQVGGGFHGEGTDHNAERTYIAAGAQLRADATEQGDGGSVAIWADLRTDMLGRISARGGRLGGHGGMVETSGLQQLNMPSGGVDVSAVRGRAGHWLLDPANLTISNASSSGSSGASPFEPSADGAVLSVTVLNNALAAGTGVTVRTTSGAGTAAETGDIIVDAAIQGTHGGSLTLDAVGSIGFTGGGSISATGGALNVSLLAGAGVSATSILTNGGTLGVTAHGAVTLDSVNSGALTIASNGGAVTLPTGTIGGLLSLTTGGGAITQAAGSLSTAGATFDAAAGSVTLGSLGSSVDLGVTTTTGSIAQASGTALSVSGTTSLSTTAGTITLDATGNSLQGAVSASGGATTLTNAGALVLGSTTVSSLTATAVSGSITQAGGTGLSVSGATRLTASGAITLNAASNSLQGTVTASGGATTLTNAGALVLGNVTASSLTATAASGNITQSGGTGLGISGATSLTASSGAITLDATNNNLQGAVSVSGGAASLLNAGTLTLGNSSVSSLSATASSGNLAQAAGTSIAVSGATDLTASSGTITLDGTANTLQGTVTASGGATTLTSASLQLGGSTVSSLTATAASGSITQATGTHLGVAGATDLTASGAITLDAATNSLQGIVSASGGATTLTTAGALTLGNVTAGSLSATATSGDITQAASTHLSVSGAASFTASGAITLDAATNTLQGTVNASGGATTLSSASLRLGDVNVSSLAATAGGGSLTQASGTQLSVSGAADLTASGAITLDLTTNNLQGAVTTSGGATTLANAGSLTLGNATVSSLTATASAGNIVQASGTSLGVSGATSLTASSGAITLDAATNNLQGAVGVSGGAASLLNAGTLTLGNSSVSALTARSLSGNITQAGSTSIGVSGTTDLTASSGTITLSGAGNSLQGTVNASGGATTLRSAALTLGTLNVSALTATAGSGNLAQAAATSVAVSGATSLTASAGTITLNETGNGLQGAVSVSGGATTLRNGGTLVLGNGTVASLMATSDNGDIAQAASTRLAVTGSTRLTASNGAITLDATANNLQGTVTASGGATTLTSAGLRLGDSSVSSLTATATSGNLTQAAGTGLVVSSTTNLAAGSGAITLNEAGNNLQGTVSASGGATTLRSAALTLGNSSVNSLTATATSGNIAQAASSAITVNGAATLTATSGSVTLGSFSTTGGSANLGIATGSGTVTLGTGTVGGTLGVSTSGNITQVAGGLTVNGLATLNAGTTGDISLTDTHNHWNGVSINARSLDLFSAGNLGVQSLTLAANQSLTLSAQGNLNLGSTLDINTGTGDLSLTSLGGSFTAAGKLTGHDIALTAQSGLSLSDNVSASGTLSLTTGSGGIAQTGGRISAVGAASVDAGTSAIQLDRSANDFHGAVSLRGGATQIQSSGALTLGTLHTGNLTATSHGDLDLGEGTVAGTLSAQANGHLIKQTGALTLTGAITLNAGNAAITLDDAQNDLQGALTATGGGVSLRSAHDLHLVSLTQLPNQALVLDAGGTLFLPAGTQDIDTGSGALTLASRGGVFSTFGTLKGGNVTLRGVSVTLAHNVTASGDLIVQGTNGTINQTAGDLVVAGTSSFDAGSQSITLNGAHNDFHDAVSLTGGAAQVYSRNALKLADLATGALRAEAGNGTLQLGAGTVGGNLVARSTGAITQTGAGLDVTGTANINAGTGAITLAAAANQWGGAVSVTGAATQLKSLGAITLGSVSVGSLTLAAGGAVAQGASGITVNGALSVDAGPAAITLNNAGNQLNGNVTLTGGTTQVRTQGALRLATLDTGGLTVQSSGALNLGQGSIAGNLTASSGNGAVTQAAVLNVTGDASIQSGTGNITLTQGNNQWGGVLSLGGGVAQVSSNAGLTLGTLAVNSLAVDVTGALNLGQGTIGSGGLTASSHGGPITQVGALDVTGASNLQAGAGDITLTSAGNQWRNTVRLGGGVTQLASSGALTLGQLATGNLTVASSGALNLGLGSIAGDLVANSGGGAMTQAGALHVTGGATFTATGANITLTNSGNQFLGALSLTGNAVAVFNDLSLNFGTLSFNSLDATSNHSIVLGQGALSGALTARALGGTITQIAGGLSVGGTATLQASSGITLADAANQFGGVVNMSGGDSALTNAGALRMGTLATGALTLRAGGALDLGSGSAGSLSATSGGTITQTGALSVGGGSSLSASGSITLGQSGNTFAGAVDLQGGNTVIHGSGALRLGTLGVGDLTVKSSGALQLGRGSVSGALDASSGGQLTQASGGLAVGGASQLQAGSANIVLNEAANGFVGTVTLQGGDVSLVNQRALRMGSYTAHDLQLTAGGDIDLGGGTVNGELTATTRGTTISQSAALIVKGAANFVADGSQANLVLDNAGNQLLGAINMRGINGGSFIGVNISSALDLTFSGDVQTLVLNSGGTLTLGGGQSTTLTAGAKNGIVGTGPLVVSGLTTLIANGPAMPVDLATAGAGNDFNAVLLKVQNGGSFGRVQLRDGDAVRRDGLQVTGDAGALEVTSAGALDLGGGSYGNLLADTSATGAAITQSGALAVSALTTLKAGAGALTLARADNSLPTITVGSAGVATLVSAGNYTVNASQVTTRLDLGGPGAISLAGPLAGTGELVMNGTGSLTIGSSQGYSGGTRIESGRVVLQGPAASAGSGDVQLGANGELDLRDGAALSAALVGQGGNVLNTSGTGTLAGAVTLQALTTFLPAAGAGGLTISGAIGGTEGVRLGSAGSLTLTGSNSYSGVTDIVAGTLRANGVGSLSAASAVRLHAGAVLALGHDQAAGSLSGDGRVALDRYTLGVGADGTDTAFSGGVDGTGGLIKLGAGAFTLAGSGAHTGATQVVAGNLILASATALNATTAVAVAAGATLTVQQSASLGSLAGSGAVNLLAPLLSVGSNGGSTRFDGAIVGSGGLAKLGEGTFTLAGLNTLAGNVQVDAGTLQLQGAGVLPATVTIGVAGGAALELLSDQGLGALSGSGRVLLNPYTLTLGASGLDSRFDGVISGSGNVVKAGAGTVTLGGRNLYTGRTQVGGGTLALAAAQALASATALSIDAGARVRADADQAVASLNGAGGLVLNGGNLAAGADGRDSRFDGAVSGSGGLVKQGAGTLTLTAAASNSGATAIEAGTVRLTSSGSLGSGEIRNQGVLSLERSDAFTLDQAITGSGSLVITQGQVTLSNGGNSYSGATQVLGGSLITTAAERLPDASAVQVAAGAQLQLGGSETLASLQAAGSVRLAGNLTTRGEQVYTGSLTLANPAGITLSGTLIDASRSTNQFAGTPLGLNGGQALVTVKESLQLGDVTLSNGGHIEAERLALNGKMQLGGGSLNLVATAAPDDAKATLQGTAQVPVAGVALAVAEATVQQGSAGAITLAEGARLSVQASGGGSVLLAQDANSFKGQLSVLSGTGYGTAWVPNVKGSQGVQSLVHVSGQQVVVGGSGIEADMVYIRADQLATAGDAKLVARLPFDEFLLGKSLSAPAMTLELAPGAFGIAGAFGAIAGQPINVEVGSTETGARTTGPNAGYLTVLPKAGAQGSSVIVLAGPKVGSQVQGGVPYRFFHDGASQAIEIPVVYNGVLPLTPAASGALSSINGDAEDARRARFQETVRTENVTVRLRSGVIAEVGPGRPSTQGSEGARPPVSCTPATQPALSCQPVP